MKRKNVLSLVLLLAITLAACATTQPASLTATNAPSGTPTVPPTETALPTATTTPTASSTPTPEPTATEEPTPTPETIATSIDSLIAAADYQAVVSGLQEAVEAGQYDTMKEAITEVLLPIFREQTVFSERVFEQIVPDFAAVKVNENGQLEVVDANGKYSIRTTVPGTSNLGWEIPVSKIAYGLDAEEAEKVEDWFAQDWEGGADYDPNTGLYNAWFVVDDLIQSDSSENDFELPDDTKVPTFLTAYHYGFDENTGIKALQLSLVPYYNYDPVNLRHFNFGEAGYANEFKSLEELMDFVKVNRQAAEDGYGAMTIDKYVSVKSGQIRLMQFGVPTTKLTVDNGSRKYYEETIGIIHSREQMEGWATDGRPDEHLLQTPYGPLWVPINDGTSSNVLTNLQED